MALICLSQVGCASLFSRKQTIKVASDQDSAEVYLDNRYLGKTPNFFTIKRGKNRRLTLKSNGSEQSYDLKTKYRWNQSLIANLLIPPYGLLGLGIDWWTGAAWEFEPVPMIVFQPGQKIKLKKPSIIAILPPQHENLLVSAEIADEMRLLIQQRYPDAKLVSQSQSYMVSEAYEYRHDQLPNTDLRDSLYLDLGATHIVESQVFHRGDSFEVETQVIDVFRDVPTESFTAKTTVSKIESAKPGLGNKLAEWAIGLLPNSVGMQSGTRRFFREEGQTVSQDYEVRMIDSGFLGSRVGIAFANLYHPKVNRGLRFRFRWASSFYASASRAQVYSPEENSAFSNIDYDWYQVGVGVGPEIALQLSAGYAYIRALPRLSLDYIVTGANSSLSDFSKLNGGVVGEAGYTVFLSDRWNIRIFAESVDESIWGEIVKDETGAEVEVPRINFSGVAIQYFFPEAKLSARNYLNSSFK